VKQKHLALLALASGCVLAAALPGAALGADGTENAYQLTLDECLGTALENNLDLLSIKKDPLISAQQVESNKGEFDPAIGANLSADETKQDPTDPTQPSLRRNSTVSAGILQELPVGADYSVNFFLNRNDAPGFNRIGFDDSAPPQPVEINPRFDAGIDMRFNMPLLRGLGKEVRQEQLLLSVSDLTISKEELSRQAQQTIEITEGAYWDVLAAQEALRVALASEKRAQDLLELNRKKVEVGTLAPIEITQAEAGVAAEEENVIISEVTLANAEDELRRLMALPPNDPRWERPLEIVDRPAYEPQDIDVASAINEALEHRPEMATVDEQLRKRELNERAARNRVKHGLDLALRFQPSGNNDGSFPDPNPVNNPNAIIGVEQGFSDAIAEIFDVENYTWSAGLNYSVPIGNKAAKANLRIAELNTQKSEIGVLNQEQTIRVEVRAAAREVESGTKRIAAASKNVELQEKKLDAEEKKFQNGMSTSFEVLSFQRDLADAELSRIRAALNYVKALAALERSKGTLLQARGLKLAD
jgi:outer membrane protein TolC